MRKSRFANVISHEGEYLIHNSLFGGVVKAKCSDSKAFLGSIESGQSFVYDENEGFHKVLSDMRMIVDDAMEESNLVDYYYMGSQGHELLIIPIVTRQCNFRCIYCYEEFRNEKMSAETWQNLLKAIEFLIDLKSYKSLRISYFGGEPLLEYGAICDFAEKLKELAHRKNVALFSGMTTNGYLLTKERLNKLISLNVTDYQITIDGLQKTHDNARFLVGKGGTWQTIIQNLIDAKDSPLDFKIVIRTNFTQEIFQSAEEYLKYISQYFMGDNRFGFHFEAVKTLHHTRNAGKPMEAREETNIIYEMAKKGKELGLNMHEVKPSLFPFGLVCYAAKNDSLTIDCNGTVMKCTVHIDEAANHVGSIADGGLFIKDHLMSCWTTAKLPDKCSSCKILPICYGKHCPAIAVGCHEEPCNRLLSIYEDTLKVFYLM